MKLTDIDSTNYPRFKRVDKKLLDELFTPTEDEIAFVNLQTRNYNNRVVLMIIIKVYSFLGQKFLVKNLPIRINDHIAKCLNYEDDIEEVTKKMRLQYFNIARSYVGLKNYSNGGTKCAEQMGIEAAKICTTIPDIINMIVKMLELKRYELPTFKTLHMIATKARSAVNEQCFETINNYLSPKAKNKIDILLNSLSHGNSTMFDSLKKDAGKASQKNSNLVIKFKDSMKSVIKGIDDVFDQISPFKYEQYYNEAMALDAAKMMRLKPAKKYALCAIMLRSQFAKAHDDITDIFFKTFRPMVKVAKENKEQEIINQFDTHIYLIGCLEDIATKYKSGYNKLAKFKSINDLLKDGKEDELIQQCRECKAMYNDDHFPFLVKVYTDYKRSIIFNCLSALELATPYADKSILKALDFCLKNRRNKEELIVKRRELNLDWISKRWKPYVIAKSTKKRVTLNKEYFELCLFEQVAMELESGDLYVINGHKYCDTNIGLISDEELEASWQEHCRQLQLPDNLADIITCIKDDFRYQIYCTNGKFPKNDCVDIKKDGNKKNIKIKKKKQNYQHKDLEKIDQLINEHMPEVNITEVLIDIVGLLGLHKKVKPLSGLEAKIKEPLRRFIATLLCYGCNLGPHQTARAIEEFNSRQISLQNLKHITTRNLDEMIKQVINAYNSLDIPNLWGDGDSVSVDGTMFELMHHNLFADHHFRYKTHGGVAYYHVSDKYIAVFSQFISCGTYEAIHIFDAMFANESDIQPSKVHGDTQAQNTVVFGLAYLLGIDLMPRIRGISDLDFYKANKADKYSNIDDLFGNHVINWKLIATHFKDMLRVAISIKQGRVSPSSILRRLGNKSRKNKLYFAFRELGYVARTNFLLNYIDDGELRSNIHAATCKSEEFNNFIKWVFFGGDGIITKCAQSEREKMIKYSHLVSSMIILHTSYHMTLVINDLTQKKNYKIPPEVIKQLSPYRTSYINRFGIYYLDIGKKKKINLKQKLEV